MINTSSSAPTHALIVEDNENDFLIIQDMLRHVDHGSYDLEWVSGISKAGVLLEEKKFDILLLDLGLPESAGEETLNKLMRYVLRIPTIVMTGRDDEQLAIRTVEKGAQDYLVKGHFNAKSLTQAIHYAIVRKNLTVELESSNNKLEQFAHFISHDLRAPLRHIQFFMDRLIKDYGDKLDKKANHYMQTVFQSANTMDCITQDILEFSRMGKGNLVSAETDLTECLKKAIANLESLITERHAKVFINPLPAVKVYKVLIQQVFQNLIGNAIKYSKRKYPAVIISGAREADQIVIQVQDNGIGIPEDKFKKIFEGFYRVHSSQEFPGNGIGLAICKKIIEEHGGQIWVESRLGEGSTFKIAFPATHFH